MIYYIKRRYLYKKEMKKRKQNKQNFISHLKTTKHQKKKTQTLHITVYCLESGFIKLYFTLHHQHELSGGTLTLLLTPPPPPSLPPPPPMSGSQTTSPVIAFRSRFQNSRRSSTSAWALFSFRVAIFFASARLLLAEGLTSGSGRGQTMYVFVFIR